VIRKCDNFVNGGYVPATITDNDCFYCNRFTRDVTYLQEKNFIYWNMEYNSAIEEYIITSEDGCHIR